MRVLLVLGWLVLNCVALQAQHPAYWRLTEDDGLPSMTVYRIKQDTQGYIWLGTENGLHRYDGKSFRSYTHHSLKDFEVFGLDFDAEGVAWFFNFSGQLCHLKNDSLFVQNLSYQGEVLNIKDLYISRKHKIIYLICGEYFVRYSSETHEITQAYHFKHFIRNRLTEDGDGKVWFTHMEGITSRLSCYDPEKQLFTDYSVGRDWELTYLENGRMIGFFRALDTLVEVGTDGITHFIMPQEEGNSTLEVHYDEPNELWVTSRNGARLYNLNMKQVEGIPTLLPTKTVNHILKDREGNYWMSVPKEGLYIFPSLNIQSYDLKDQNISAPVIRAISGVPEKDEVLVGTQNGELVRLRQNKVVSTLLMNQIEVTDIMRHAGRYWALDGSSAIYLSKDASRIEAFFGTGCKKGIWDREGKLWGAGYSRVGLWSSEKEIRNTSSFQEINGVALKFVTTPIVRSVLKQRMLSVFEDRFDDRIWIGGRKYLYYSDLAGNDVARFLNKGKQFQTQVLSIAQTKDSTLWIGTQKDGLFLIKKDSVFAHITHESGFLPSNHCPVVWVDEKDIVWVGTNKGLVRCENLLAGEAPQYFTRHDGLISDNILSIYTQNGHVWVGTNKGLSVFADSISPARSQQPLLYLTNFAIWEKDSLLHKHYELSHNQNNIRISFQGISFRSQGDLIYEYRMLGIDSTWLSVEEGENVIRYPSLKAGKYTFEIRVRDVDGISSEIQRLSLQVHLPFWQRAWFIILMISLFAILVGLIVYTYFQRKQKQVETERYINQLRIQALQSQMNPHFIFNSLNAIQLFLTTNEQEHAMMYLAQFARLIRLIFEHSRQTLITLEEEIDFLQLYLKLEALRFEDKVEVEFYVPEHLDTSAIYIPPLLIQPIIENSFKHGLLHKKGIGRLKVHIWEDEQLLHCLVEDNGVGRKAAQKFASWTQKQQKSSAGLSTVKDRLRLFNDEISQPSYQLIDLYDDAGEAAGTRTLIRIRLSDHIETNPS